MDADVEEASTSSQPPPAKRQRRTDGDPCGLEKKHKLFLSHSGADKAFVSHLCRRLISVHHYPFFDVREDSLPLGDKFADIIFQACKQCQLAIVVVSDDYFKSKWPMLELASFVEAKNGVNPEMKILPLFYRLTVAQCKERERQRAWFEKWERLKESDKPLNILRWKDALRVLLGHHGAVYCGTGQTEDEYIESIVQLVFRSVPPDVLYDNSHVKGGTYLCEVIDGMFEKSWESRLTGRVQCPVIGIYGLGGIGKTNLCQIAYNKFVGEFFGRACLLEIGSKTKSALESQREVLRALTGAHDDLLSSITDVDKGRRLYKERVGSHKVFLAVDNVWDDSQSLEEADAYLVHELHPESKVLVTARCKKTLTNLGIKEECCFEMPDLSEEDAINLFLHNACPSLPPIDLENPEHVKVVKECILYARYSKGGDTEMSRAYHFHPLALKVLGLFIKTLTPFPSKWIEKLNNPKILGSKVKDIYFVLRTSFDMLPEDDHRAMFLDVAIYAPKRYYHDYNSPTVEEVCEWLSIVYVQEIEVVKDKLEVLCARGLLNQWDDLTDYISMHDLYLDFAEVEVKRDDTLQGQAHLYHKRENNIPQCLLRDPKGAKSFAFQRIRFCNVCNLDSFKQAKLDKCTNVEVLKVDYCYGLERLDIDGLEDLCSLELLECPTLEYLQGLENRDKLIWMRWDPCYAKVVDYKQLTSLRVLQLTRVSHSVPLDLRNCHNLQELAIRYSYELKDFPLFPNSKSMRKICFAYCENLRHCGRDLLNLEGWINVEFLDLACCKSLTNEMESCPIMRNLRHLDVSNCNNLLALPNLTESKKLIALNASYCVKLVGAYVTSSKFVDSMPMGLHVGLTTSRLSSFVRIVVSTILGKGIFSQEAQQSLIDSLGVHNFEPFGSQYAVVRRCVEKVPNSTTMRGVRVMGLYGVRGIGKTQICKIMCNEFYGEFAGKVCHVELGSQSEHELVKKVLTTLTNVSVEVAQEMGKDQCREVLLNDTIWNQRTFLTIDNVWDDFSALEQAKLYLRAPFVKGSWVMVTSPSKKTLKCLNLNENACFTTNGVEDIQARCIVGGKKFHNMENVYPIEECVESHFGKCEGGGPHCHPLALKAIGPRAKRPSILISNDLQKGKDSIYLWGSKNPGNFHRFPTWEQQLFVDIALFSPEDRSNLMDWLHLVHLEKKEAIRDWLRHLLDMGLLEVVDMKPDWSKRVSTHDLYREFAKLESQGNLVPLDMKKRRWVYVEDTLPQELEDEPRDCWKRLTRVCIAESYETEKPITSLQMIKWKYYTNLVVLKLDNLSELSGVLNLKDLVHLRSLSVKIQNLSTCRSIEGLEGLNALVYFKMVCTHNQTCTEDKLTNVRQLPASLKHLEVEATVSFDQDVFALCTKLVWLKLWDVHAPQLDLKHCTSLKEVELRRMKGLKIFQGLALEVHCRLRWLKISGCDELVEVRGLDHLFRLRTLELECNQRLSRLPSLISCDGLNSLTIRCCPRLSVLPCLMRLRRLRKLEISELGTSDARILRGLKQLEVINASRNKRRPSLQGFRDLPQQKSDEWQECESRHAIVTRQTLT